MNKEWHNLSDADATLLEDAIIQSEEFAERLAVFRSGLISPEKRWLQLSAHKIYDDLSARELEVFKMRTLKHTFPVIADALDISVSSAKTYWRRCLAKCTAAFMSTNESISDG
jgi:DNA-binding CsgD family transcriptional regulator